MYKVGVCGVFGEGENLLNGQTIKTKTLTDQLRIQLNADSVKTLDTWKWKKKPLSLAINCFKMVKDCENVVILPAHNGVKIFSAVFLILNFFYKRKLHYFIIGGWLPELLKKDIRLKKRLSRFHNVYAETHTLYESLKKMNLENVEILSNFKDLSILEKENLVYQKDKPYKLCTFSKVLKGKGIEDAIFAVKEINSKSGKTLYTLDIYGEIDINYKKKFDELTKEFPNYIRYKGEIDYNKSVNTLKDYYLLLFPTLFKTEGHPGTIIDAFAAGVPVVASRWNSAAEIIDEELTGFLYEFSNKEKLVELLNSKLNEIENINLMKFHCLKKAQEYSAENVVKKFIENLS